MKLGRHAVGLGQAVVHMVPCSCHLPIPSGSFPNIPLTLSSAEGILCTFTSSTQLKCRINSLSSIYCSSNLSAECLRINSTKLVSSIWQRELRVAQYW